MNETWWVKLKDLDSDQKQVIELPQGKSYLITGPPGSGKTNLLILRGQYLVRAGRPEVLILVFTRALKEFITAGCGNYGFSKDKVQTSLNWAKSFLREHGVKFEQQGEFSEVRESLWEEVANLVRSKKLSRIYDAILLDEAHDYTPKEIGIFTRLAKEIFAVADNRQKIYDSPEVMESLKSVVSETFKLQYHYRNGMKICKAADAVAHKSDEYEPITKHSNYDEKDQPSKVLFHRCETLKEQADTILKNLEAQLKAFPKELLGVIVPTHSDLEGIWPIFASSKFGSLCVMQSNKHGYVAFDDSKRICLCTMHSAKGLEFRAVHIAGCEKLKKFAAQRRMAFTGITRAKTSLDIYYSGDLPSYLESARNTLFPPKAAPKASDLFKGGE